MAKGEAIDPGIIDSIVNVLEDAVPYFRTSFYFYGWTLTTPFTIINRYAFCRLTE